MLFPTLVHVARLRGAPALNRALADECARIRAADAAGERWSRKNYPHGYTSYGSLDQLHRMSSTLIGLRERIDREVAVFAKALHWDLRGGTLEMTDCWMNVMGKGAAHTRHLHPHAVVSGTYYVQTPRGAAGLKFEDPRLSSLIAAPARKAGAPPAMAAHFEVPAVAGQVVLFESWLRHEVPASTVAAERVSLSFNYHWRA